MVDKAKEPARNTLRSIRLPPGEPSQCPFLARPTLNRLQVFPGGHVETLSYCSPWAKDPPTIVVPVVTCHFLLESLSPLKMNGLFKAWAREYGIEPGTAECNRVSSPVIFYRVPRR